MKIYLRHLLVVLITAAIITILLGSKDTLAQCNIESINRPDGQVAYRVRNSPSGPIAYNNYLQMVLNVGIISDSYYISGIFRWRDSRKVIKDNIGIIMENGNTLSLPIIDRRDMEAGGSNVTAIIYEAGEEDIDRLKTGNMDVINVNINGNWVVLDVKGDTKYLDRNISCLEEKLSSEGSVEYENKDNDLINYVTEALNAEVSINERTGSIESYYGGYKYEVNVIELDKEAVSAGYGSIMQTGFIELKCKEKKGADSEYLSFTPRKKCVSVYGSLESSIEEKSKMRIKVESGLFRPKNAEAVFKKIIEDISQ